jgi:hypothetical protein
LKAPSQGSGEIYLVVAHTVPIEKRDVYLQACLPHSRIKNVSIVLRFIEIWFPGERLAFGLVEVSVL